MDSAVPASLFRVLLLLRASLPFDERDTPRILANMSRVLFAILDFDTAYRATRVYRHAERRAH